MLRRLLSFLLFALLIVSMGGVYPFLKLEQWEIQSRNQRITNQLSEKNTLKSFHITHQNQNKFTLLDDGREISYHHRLYDVVKIKKCEDGFLLIVNEDEEETRVVAKINALIQHEQHPAAPYSPLKQFVKRIMPFYIQTAAYTFPGNSSRGIILANHSTVHSLTGYTTIPGLPPECRF